MWSANNIVAHCPERLRQPVLAIAYALRPKRLPDLPPLFYVLARDLPKANRPLVPDADSEPLSHGGLWGLAGRLDTAHLVQGYARGYFVFSHAGPLKWWSPPERMILTFDKMRVEKTTRRLMRNGRFTITMDTAFDQVMLACAQPRPGATPLTWITAKIRALFQAAHREGYAHSVEVWENGELVGGVYGLAVGGVFFTESQSHTVRDASKVAFAVLNKHLQAWGYVANDGKRFTRYLADAGMTLVPRADFNAILAQSADGPPRGPWQLDPALITAD